MGTVVDWECQVEYRRVIHRNDKRYSEIEGGGNQGQDEGESR